MVSIARMKRGFLNSTKAKSRPLGPIPSEATRPVPASEPAPSMCCPQCAIEKGEKGDYFVPEGFPYTKTFHEKRDPREDPRDGNAPGTMRFTSIPFLSDDNEQVSECLFYPGSKELLMQIPNFPHPILRVDTPAFCVTDTSGKGMGLVSTRALKMGDLILDERPLFVCSHRIPLPEPPSTFTHEKFMEYHLQKLEEYYQHSLGRMRPKARNAYLALHNCHKEDGSGPAVGIARTNGMALPGGLSWQQTTTCFGSASRNFSRLGHLNA
ncbi:ER lumen protein-retaining receptor [Mycena sanguinolenta]|uniref:ER lumen protein-retaining receptor n=1 Tax=Mycena sanguinolenta TaxID=230812 RepID=A0A8H7CX01_9AGAR|nr:ER lumen protein-retaining receptor [Mycena sanguinolenta]